MRKIFSSGRRSVDSAILSEFLRLDKNDDLMKSHFRLGSMVSRLNESTVLYRIDNLR